MIQSDKKAVVLLPCNVILLLDYFMIWISLSKDFIFLSPRYEF